MLAENLSKSLKTTEIEFLMEFTFLICLFQIEAIGESRCQRN